MLKPPGVIGETSGERSLGIGAMGATWPSSRRLRLAVHGEAAMVLRVQALPRSVPDLLLHLAVRSAHPSAQHDRRDDVPVALVYRLPLCRQGPRASRSQGSEPPGPDSAEPCSVLIGLARPPSHARLCPCRIKSWPCAGATSTSSLGPPQRRSSAFSSWAFRCIYVRSCPAPR